MLDKMLTAVRLRRDGEGGPVSGRFQDAGRNMMPGICQPRDPAGADAGRAASPSASLPPPVRARRDARGRPVLQRGCCSDTLHDRDRAGGGQRFAQRRSIIQPLSAATTTNSSSSNCARARSARRSRSASSPRSQDKHGAARRAEPRTRGAELIGIFARIANAKGQVMSISAREGAFLALTRVKPDTIILRLVRGPRSSRRFRRERRTAPTPRACLPSRRHDLPIDLPAIEKFPRAR